MVQSSAAIGHSQGSEDIVRGFEASGGLDALGAARLAEVLGQPEELERRGALALEYARAHFTPERSVERLEEALLGALDGGPETPR